MQSGRKVLRKFNGNYFKMMQYVFPEVSFNVSGFRMPLSLHPFLYSLSFHISLTFCCLLIVFAADIENRREFFLRYARHAGFNPLVPENWYKQSKKSLLAAEVSLLSPLFPLYHLFSSFSSSFLLLIVFFFFLASRAHQGFSSITTEACRERCLTSSHKLVLKTISFQNQVSLHLPFLLSLHFFLVYFSSFVCLLL